MNGRELTRRTLLFQNPGRVPLDLWIHKATALRYGKDLDDLLAAHPRDLVRIFGPMDRAFYEVTYLPGMNLDEWGSTWQVIQAGMVGEVKIPALGDISRAEDYRPPTHLLEREWRDKGDDVFRKIEEAGKRGQFILGGDIEVFQRMQFVRGTENLYCDLGERNENVIVLRDKIVEYFHAYLEYWLPLDVDGIMFFDDWGSQLSLLIDPVLWREVFKPVYRDFVRRIRAAGKFAFFHCDGFILDLYPEFIELGIHAVNSQIWCMGLEQVSRFAGKMTFWGEIDRQNVLAFGTPEDVRAAAKLMKEKLLQGGGLIGQSVAGVDVPWENIRALLECWNEE